MMNPDRNNYERWALDYLEGTLSARECESFERFMAENADLADEIRGLSPLPVLPVENIAYPDARTLLRGGRRIVLRRAGSLLSGAAAASLLVGLFVWADRTVSQGKQELLSQRIVLPTEGMPVEEEASEFAEETSASASDADVSEFAMSVSRERLRPAGGRSLSVGKDKISGTQVAEAVPEVVALPVLSPGMERKIEIKYAENLAVPTEAALSVPRSAFEIPKRNDMKTDDRRGRFAAKSDENGMSQEENGESRNFLSYFLAPLDYIIPIKTYRTENESGIEIASLIRIGNRKTN